MSFLNSLKSMVCFNDDANVTRAMRRINENGINYTVTVINPDTRQRVVIVDYDYFEHIYNKSGVRRNNETN